MSDHDSIAPSPDTKDTTNAGVDWKTLFFDAAVQRQLAYLAEQRFPQDATLRDEASTAALEALSADEFARLTRSYRGGASPEAFLITAWSNAIEDFARRRFGRPRPPRAVQRLGGLALEIYRLLCLERRPAAAVAMLLAARHGLTESLAVDRIRAVRARTPNCGERMDFIAIDAEEGMGAAVAARLTDEMGGPDEQLAVDLREEVISLLGDIVGGPPARRSAMGRVAADLSARLGDDDRALLRLHFQERVPITTIARMLTCDARQLYQRLERIRFDLRAIMNRHGLSLSDLVTE